MTLKEQITDLLREQGYDFISACEEYEMAKARGLFSQPGTVNIGNLQVKLGAA